MTPRARADIVALSEASRASTNCSSISASPTFREQFATLLLEAACRDAGIAPTCRRAGYDTAILHLDLHCLPFPLAAARL